jgi:putative flavoprotein involved in K+ transport
LHERGIVAREPGLYFLGLQYLYAMTSDTVNGVGRDAERIAKAVQARSHARVTAPNDRARFSDASPAAARALR